MTSLNDVFSKVTGLFFQWDRLRHPYAGWVRLALALTLPFVIWSHNILLIILWPLAFFSHSFWFPPYVEASEDVSVMTKLTDRAHKWMDESSRAQKTIIFIPGLFLFLPLVCFLWKQSLFWSLYFFIAVAANKYVVYNYVLRDNTAHDDTHGA